MPTAAHALDANMTRLDRYRHRTQTPLDVLALVTLWLVAVPPTDFGVDVGAAIAARTALSGVYALDFAIRIYLAPNHWRYFVANRRFIVVVILPTTRLLFSVRLLTSGFRRGSLLIFGGVAFALFVNGATIVYFFEHHAQGANIRTYGEALWWGVVTVSTVGYGDFYPVTTGGRLTAVMLMVLGVTVLAVVTAQIASSFISQAAREPTTSTPVDQEPSA
jgi:voltage-gated potassium channel